MENLIGELCDRDDKKAFAKTKEIAARSEQSDEYYVNLQDFAVLLTDTRSYVRVRGFILCASQARWEKEGRLEALLPQMLALFCDPKPTVVRQCLRAAQEIAVFCPKLCERLTEGVHSIDLSQYKESMRPLIECDMEELASLIEEVQRDCV